MEGHAKKCVERYCEFANKTTQQLFNVDTPCTDDHQFRQEEIGSVGRLVKKVCSQIVLECLYLARIGWTVTKLALAVMKWTKACEKRMARLISYIHHTNEYRQYCCGQHNTTVQAGIVSIQDSDCAGDLEDSK